jgi:hypothetical protein
LETTPTLEVDMIPRPPPRLRQPPRAELPKDVEDQVRAGIEASDRGDVMELTSEEAEHYYDTGELPERVERWAASRG